MDNSTFNVLQTELEFYRQNQSQFEVEIRSLIADNQRLSQQVGMLLQEKLQSAQHAEDGEVDELRQQVALLTKERDSLHVLWETSQKTVYALETELKTYQCYDRRGQQPNITDDRRDLELKLETALTDYIEIEAKYKTLNTKHKNLENEIKSKDKDIASYKERGKELEVKVEELSKSLDEYKINLAVEKKNNEDVKAQLAMCQKDAVGSVKREAEAKSKVAEALQLFDAVTAQKNEAYKKIAELTGELTQVKLSLTKVKREAESSYRKELDDIRDKYNEKVADMLTHIQHLDTELVEKGLMLNRTLRENKILQETNEGYMKQQNDCLKAVNPKLRLAEEKVETMFKELVASERRNMQLQCEKQCLAMDIHRIQDAQAREIKRRDWEENLLKTQCQELRVQVEHLQKSLDETHGRVEKLQKMMSSRTELSHKMVSSKEEELLELNKHLENQMELNRKWKESYVEMTEKLKSRLESLQKENEELKSKIPISESGSGSSS